MTDQPAPTKKSGGASNAIIGVLVVLVVAALGGVGYLLFKPDDSSESSAPPSTSAAAAPPASSTAPAGNTVTHKSGKFSIVLPANGWQTKSDAVSTIAPGAPSIQFAPDLAAYSKGDGTVRGFAMVYLTGNAKSPEQYVSSAKESNGEGCEWSKAKVFEYKQFTGTFVDRKPCTTPASDGSTANYDAIQLGVTGADGTKVGMVIRDAPGETSTRMIALAALESLKAG